MVGEEIGEAAGETVPGEVDDEIKGTSIYSFSIFHCYTFLHALHNYRFSFIPFLTHTPAGWRQFYPI